MIPWAKGMSVKGFGTPNNQQGESHVPRKELRFTICLVPTMSQILF